MSIAAPPRYARGPGVVQAAVAAVILALITIVGLRVTQSPPPQIAAFAPVLQQNKANPLSAAIGNLGGAAPGGVPTPTPSPTPTPTASPGTTTTNTHAVRHCYGNPPRQTPDPLSPPCVPYYDPNADNGGATTMGVTKDAIYVAWPDMGDPNDGFYRVDVEQNVKDFATYVNNAFELYNRKIVLVPFRVQNAVFNTNAASQMQQDAARAENANTGGHIFASIGYAPEYGAAFHYYDQLAADGVVSVESDILAEDHTQRYPTYEWQVVTDSPGLTASTGAMICNQLQGHAPQFVGNGQWPPQRTFRIVVGGAGDGQDSENWDYQPLLDDLKACGLGSVTVDQLSAGAANVAADLSTNHISTVICVCVGGGVKGQSVSDLMNADDSDLYHPEYLLPGEDNATQDSQISTAQGNANNGYPGDDLNEIIGLWPDNRIDQPGNMFWYQALRETDPSYAYGDNSLDFWNQFRYEQLMLLASGIQAAGPNLTPQSFQQGLYNLTFPDPNAAAAPYWQPHAGFGPRYPLPNTWFQDQAAVWVNSQAQNYTTNEPRTGAFCYSQHGQRSYAWRDVTPTFYNNQSCR